EPPAMLIEQVCPAPRIAARPPRAGLDQHLEVTRRRDAEKSKTQQPAKLAHARITRAAAATRHAHSKPDLIADGAAIDTLQQELEIQAELQLTNNDERRLLAADGNEIAAADFAFDVEAETLEEALHREVKGGFPFRWPLPICSLTWHGGQLQRISLRASDVWGVCANHAADDVSAGLTQPPVPRIALASACCIGRRGVHARRTGTTFPLRFCFVPGSIPKCPQMRCSDAGTSRFSAPSRVPRDLNYACGKLLSFRSRIISVSSTSAFRASEEGIHHGGQRQDKWPV